MTYLSTENGKFRDILKSPGLCPARGPLSLAFRTAAVDTSIPHHPQPSFLRGPRQSRSSVASRYCHIPYGQP